MTLHATFAQWLAANADAVAERARLGSAAGGDDWDPPHVDPPADDDPGELAAADAATVAVASGLIELAVLSDDVNVCVAAVAHACTAGHVTRLAGVGHAAVRRALATNDKLPWSLRRDLVIESCPLRQAAAALRTVPGDLDAWVRVSLRQAQQLTTDIYQPAIVDHPVPAAAVHAFALALWPPEGPHPDVPDQARRVVWAHPALRPATLELIPVTEIARALDVFGKDPSSAFHAALVRVLSARLGADERAWQMFARMVGDWHGSIGALLALHDLLERPAVGAANDQELRR